MKKIYITIHIKDANTHASRFDAEIFERHQDWLATAEVDELGICNITKQRNLSKIELYKILKDD